MIAHRTQAKAEQLLDRLGEIAARATGENLFSDIDALRHGVLTTAGQWCYLTPRLWRAFEMLEKHRGSPVDVDRLAAAVWPAAEPYAENSRRQLVLELRQALAGTRWAVKTWRLDNTAYELVAGRPGD
jgi:DNA-binding response OmpR family regulator